MSGIRDWQKIQAAIKQGLVREQGVAAEIDQPLTFILSDRKFFHHASLESAKAEKEFLQTALGKRIRLYKVWNTTSDQIKTDMGIIRKELKQESNGSSFFLAIDRVLTGAGF